MKRALAITSIFIAALTFQSSLAFAADPLATLTWERGRYQVVNIDSPISAKLTTLELIGNNVTEKFTAQNLAADKTTYQINIPANFGLGSYTIRGIFNDNSILDYANVKIVSYQSTGYNPAADFKNTSKLIFSFFTFLVLFAGRGLTDSFKDDETTYEGISSESIGRDTRSSEKYRRGMISSIGLDEYRNRSVIALSRFSPLGSRLVADGGYLQYSLGPLVFLFPIIGGALGILAFKDISGVGHITTPSLTTSILIIILGALDAGAAFLTFMFFTALAISSRYFENFYDLRTLLGLGALWFTPALIANGTRPLRRSAKDVGLWERSIDILLGTLATGWAVNGLVKGLNGFAHLKLPLSGHATVCAYFAMGAIFLRYLIEEYVNHRNHFYLNYLSPNALFSQNSNAKIFSWFIKGLLYIFFIVSFIGVHWQLWVALALFMLPTIIGNFKSKLPNFPLIYQLLPVGIPALVAMTFINRFYQSWVGELAIEPVAKSKLFFILFALPSFLISLLKMFGRTPRKGDLRWYLRPRYKVFYRSAGPLLLILAILLTLGII